jgi:hypothetical protein
VTRTVRLSLLLGLGVALLFRGLQEYDRYLASVGEPAESSASPVVSAPAAPPPTVDALSKSDSDQWAGALEEGNDHTMEIAAWAAIRDGETSPRLRGAVDRALSRTSNQELRRLLMCLRARERSTPLSDALDALPAEPADAMVWNSPGASCLVDVIGVRAAEDPQRVHAIFVQRALANPSESVLQGLRQIDMPELSSDVERALDSPTRRVRLRAVEIAIALGAASKWPAIVRRALDNNDRGIRLAACRALADAPGEAAAAALARAWVSDPRDEEVARLAEARVRQRGGLDIALAQVAADPDQPLFARQEAVRLVGLHGGVDAGHILAPAARSQPDLRAEIEAAILQIEQRTGASLRAVLK